MKLVGLGWDLDVYSVEAGCDFEIVCDLGILVLRICFYTRTVLPWLH